MKKSFLLLSMLLIVALFSACHKQPTLAEMAQADYGPYPEKYDQLIKDKMITMLYDPYSAQYHFQGTPTKRYVSKPFGGGIEYGWGGVVLVNAKNRMGGYVGARPYMYLIKNGAVVALEEQYQY